MPFSARASRGRPGGRADVLFLHFGDVTGSSRALRQLRVLSGMGLRVEAVGVGPVRDAGALPDGVAYTALPAPGGRGPAVFWAAHRAVRAAALDRPARVVHASDLHVLPAAAAAAGRHGARLAYDAREWYAGLDASAGRPLVGRVWAAVESRYAPQCSVVFTVNGAIADRLAAERRIARPVVMHNATDAPRGARTGALRKRLGIDAAQPIVLYQGLFRPGRGLPHLVDALVDVPDAVLVLIGEGAMERDLRALAADRLPGRAHVLPFTPPGALARLTPDADLGALALEPLTESLRLALPNKLFEYAAADVPVLAGAGIVPLHDAVERYGAGVVADPADRDGLVAALRRGLDPGRRAGFQAGLGRLREAFAYEHEAARFRTAYAALLSGPAEGGRTFLA
ncbi:MAG TPA: glycosyltransferase family 4 protein [Rubricoccaceae bacterium]